MSLSSLQILNALPILFSFLWQRNINHSPSPGIPPSQKILWVGCYDTSLLQTGYFSCKRTQKLFSPAYSEKKIIKETNTRGFCRHFALYYSKTHQTAMNINRCNLSRGHLQKFVAIALKIFLNFDQINLFLGIFLQKQTGKPLKVYESQKFIS